MCLFFYLVGLSHFKLLSAMTVPLYIVRYPEWFNVFVAYFECYRFHLGLTVS